MNSLRPISRRQKSAPTRIQQEGVFTRFKNCNKEAVEIMYPYSFSISNNERNDPANPWEFKLPTELKNIKELEVKSLLLPTRSIVKRQQVTLQKAFQDQMLQGMVEGVYPDGIIIHDLIGMRDIGILSFSFEEYPDITYELTSDFFTNQVVCFQFSFDESLIEPIVFLQLSNFPNRSFSTNAKIFTIAFKLISIGSKYAMYEAINDGVLNVMDVQDLSFTVLNSSNEKFKSYHIDRNAKRGDLRNPFHERNTIQLTLQVNNYEIEAKRNIFI